MPAKQYVFTVQPIRIRHAFNTYSKAHEYVFKSQAIRIHEKAYTYSHKNNTACPPSLLLQGKMDRPYFIQSGCKAQAYREGFPYTPCANCL